MNLRQIEPFCFKDVNISAKNASGVALPSVGLHVLPLSFGSPQGSLYLTCSDARYPRGLSPDGNSRPFPQTGRSAPSKHAANTSPAASAPLSAISSGRASWSLAAPAETLVIADVPRRLLEVGHDAPPLENFRQDVRCLFACQVDAAELGDTVIAVLEKHPVVQFLGSAEPHGRIDGLIAADVEIVDELLQKQPPKALRRARVSSEERSLDDFWKVYQSKNRLIEVREVPTQDVGLRGRELFCVVRGHGGR